MEQMFISFFSALGQVTSSLRGLVTSIAPEYLTLVLLGLSMGGGYYLHTRYPNLSAKATFALYGLIIFLIVRFI